MKRDTLWIPRGSWSDEVLTDKQMLLRVVLDCDRDALRFTVRPMLPGSGFCHLPATDSCFGPLELG